MKGTGAPAAQTRYCLTPAPNNDEVGEHTRGKARGEEPQSELAMPELVRGLQDLTDHVEDRAPGQRIEHELQGLGGHAVANQCADEGRAAADEPGEPEPAPARADRAQRADDPEPLGRVVQGE